MRFYLDENLSPEIARLARRRGLDVTSTYEEGREGRLDDDQLAFASVADRCIVTKDTKDFVRWTHRFSATGRPHAGVLIIAWQVGESDVSRVVVALLRFVADRPAGLQPYEVAWLKRPSDA